MAQDITIPATDGHALAATLHGDPTTARSLVTLNPATAVPRRFYRGFAQFLADRGHLALTFDYRGLGDTPLAPDTRMRDWGAKDLAGVLAWAQKEHAELPLAGFGHSAGGQMLAIAEGSERYQALVGIAAQSGYWRLWPAPLRYRRALDWHILMPAFSHTLGKVPGWTGMGHDLPGGVALEWARWCRHPDYHLSEETDERRARLSRLTMRFLSYSFSDDTYGPKLAADWLAEQFTSAHVERRHITPAELGVKNVGHFGFFRERQGGALWEPTLAWMERALGLKSS